MDWWRESWSENGVWRRYFAPRHSCNQTEFAARERKERREPNPSLCVRRSFVARVLNAKTRCEQVMFPKGPVVLWSVVPWSEAKPR